MPVWQARSHDTEPRTRSERRRGKRDEKKPRNEGKKKEGRDQEWWREPNGQVDLVEVAAIGAQKGRAQGKTRGGKGSSIRQP